MHFRTVLMGFLFLIAGAYVDSSRGPLLPHLQSLMGLNYSQGSLFVGLSYPAGFLATFLLKRAFRRYRDDVVAAWICGFALFVFAVLHLVDQFAALIGAGLLLGAVIALFGTLSNVYVIRGSEDRFRGRALSALHMMYGLGSLLASVAVVRLLEEVNHWSWAVIALPLPVAGLLLFLVWRRLRSEGAKAENQPSGEGDDTVESDSPGGPAVRVASRSASFLVIFTFCAYVASEVIGSVWMVSYLESYRNLPAVTANAVLSGFFVFMTVSRLICAFAVKEQWEKAATWVALIGGLGGQILGHMGWVWGFSVSGVMGIFFPIFVSRVSGAYPSRWRTMMVNLIAGMQVTLLICHLSMGNLSDLLSLKVSYWAPVVFLAIAAASCYAVERMWSSNKAKVAV